MGSGSRMRSADGYYIQEEGKGKKMHAFNYKKWCLRRAMWTQIDEKEEERRWNLQE